MIAQDLRAEFGGECNEPFGLAEELLFALPNDNLQHATQTVFVDAHNQADDSELRIVVPPG